MSRSFTKIDPAGANILYSTYIGGSGLDRADGIAIDASGNAYVVGRVGDTSMDFPATAGTIGPTYRGGDFDDSADREAIEESNHRWR